MKEDCLKKLQLGSVEWIADGGILGSNERLTVGEDN